MNNLAKGGEMLEIKNEDQVTNVAMDEKIISVVGNSVVTIKADKIVMKVEQVSQYHHHYLLTPNLF